MSSLISEVYGSSAHNNECPYQAGVSKLPIAVQLVMVISFRWEQTCERVINVKNNVIKKIK